MSEYVNIIFNSVGKTVYYDIIMPVITKQVIAPSERHSAGGH